MSQVIRKVAPSVAIIALALPFLALSPALAQAPRTWVSGTGDDNNPCSRTAPCKTFQGALDNNKTAAGGEINCLDPGDFGRVLITFSVTISCEAGTAGILAPTPNSGIYIAAATTDVISLRGLDIEGQGTGGGGIYIQTAKAVHIENCTIRNFRGGSLTSGIEISGLDSYTAFLFVVDTVISDNTSGVRFVSSGGYASLKNVVITGSTLDGLAQFESNTYVNITGSIVSGNGRWAVFNRLASTVNIDRSTIANNGTGLNADLGSTIRASGNNIYNNTTGILIANGAAVQSDGTNKHGNSNGGAQMPNASFAEY